MVAHWLLSSWSSRRVRILAYGSAAYTTAVTLALLVILIPGIRLPDFSHPMRALVGWEAAARRADTLLAELKHNAGNEPVLLVRNWHHARRIAWFARPAIVQDVFGKFTPYSHWFGVPDADTFLSLFRADSQSDQ